MDHYNTIIVLTRIISSKKSFTNTMDSSNSFKHQVISVSVHDRIAVLPLYSCLEEKMPKMTNEIDVLRQEQMSEAFHDGIDVASIISVLTSEFKQDLILEENVTYLDFTNVNALSICIILKRYFTSRHHIFYSMGSSFDVLIEEAKAMEHAQSNTPTESTEDTPVLSDTESTEDTTVQKDELEPDIPLLKKVCCGHFDEDGELIYTDYLVDSHVIEEVITNYEKINVFKSVQPDDGNIIYDTIFLSKEDLNNLPSSWAYLKLFVTVKTSDYSFNLVKYLFNVKQIEDDTGLGFYEMIVGHGPRLLTERVVAGNNIMSHAIAM